MGVWSGTVEGLVSNGEQLLTGFPKPDFWQGRRVLLTGHSGFKGSWLALWLSRMGADVVGISLAPVTAPNLFDEAGIAGHCAASHFQDLRDAGAVRELIRQASPEVVLHLAAQPLVRASYRDPLGTLSTNVMGTAHVLDALRGLASVLAVVVVTTDKVYRNREWNWPYREDDALGGHDPYSASKAATEIVVDCYRTAFLQEQGVRVVSARAGNVIGGGDWSEDRLIPDAIRAWSAGRPLEVRRPQSTRPWQHVLEPLRGYLVLAERLHAGTVASTSFNFGPRADESATVGQVVTMAMKGWKGSTCLWGDGTAGPHEAGRLALDVSRAAHELAVSPCWSTEQGIARTINWYANQAQGKPAGELCMTDIDAFLQAGGVAR